MPVPCPAAADGNTTNPGVCMDPVSWEALELIVADGSVERMSCLGRSEAMLQSYREFKARTAKYYASAVDLIMIKVFKCDWIVNGDRKIEHVGASTGAPGPFLVRNDFPYNMAPGIEHYLLWSDHAMPDDEVDAFLNADAMVQACTSRLTFVNPVELQSIPDLHHVHVMLKTS